MELSDEEFSAYEKEVDQLSLVDLYRRLAELPEDPSDERRQLVEFRIDELKELAFKELDERLEREYQSKPHWGMFAFKTFCAVLFGGGFAYYYMVGDSGELLAGITSLISLSLFSISAIIEKRFHVLGDSVYHKASHPKMYWANVICSFVLGIIFFAIALTNYLGVWAQPG